MGNSKPVMGHLTARSAVLSFARNGKAGMGAGRPSGQHSGMGKLALNSSPIPHHSSPFTLHPSPFTPHRCILLLLVVLISGCSTLMLGYRHADTYLTWRADSYFDLDPNQRRDFDARLAHLLSWHRYEQLPEYAGFLSTAIGRAQPGLKHDDIVWFVDGIKARYRVVIDRFVGDAAEMLSNLSPAQITSLQKQWKQDNRKFVREYELEGTLGDRKLARLRRTLSQIEDWTGDLTPEQQRRIAMLLDPIPHINHFRHQDRIRRQNEFLDLLRLRANRNEFQRRLHAWLRDWELGRTPEYARISNEVYEKRIRFYIAVDTLLTAAQRQTAQKRLHRFVEDFKSLSVRPESCCLHDRPR